MRYNVVSYLLGEGFRNVFKNKKSTMSSVMIMCATMIIFGVFFVIGENINSFVANVAEAQGLRVFATREATDEEVEKLGIEILEIDGVKNAEYISKDDAIDEMADEFGEEYSYLIDSYRGEGNFLSASYVVTLTDLELSKDVQESIMQLDNVKRITSSDDTIAQVIRLARGVRIVTFALLLLLVIISISIISNTIKLTVHARRKEISIMKYVGATNSFIRWPFLVEGVIIGMVSGIISVVIIGGVYTAIATKASASTFFTNIANWALLDFSQMSNLIILVYLILGIGIGVIGSSISMKKYLEV